MNERNEYLHESFRRVGAIFRRQRGERNAESVLVLPEDNVGFRAKLPADGGIGAGFDQVVVDLQVFEHQRHGAALRYIDGVEDGQAVGAAEDEGAVA